MMYVVFIIYHIHYLMNESKMLIFAYNSDRMVYTSICLITPQLWPHLTKEGLLNKKVKVNLIIMQERND